MPVREYTETKLQMSISDYLGGKIHNGKNVTHVQVPFPGLLWSYLGGEGRDSSDIYWLSRKGRRKGIYDYAAWHADIAPTAFETKSKNGYLSPEQIAFKNAFEAMGGITCIILSVAEVRDFYIGLGLKCMNMHCIEPPATFREKQSGYFEMFKADYENT